MDEKVKAFLAAKATEDGFDPNDEDALKAFAKEIENDDFQYFITKVDNYPMETVGERLPGKVYFVNQGEVTDITRGANV